MIRIKNHCLREEKKNGKQPFKNYYFLVVIVYVVSPIDGFPGPIDDLLVVFLGQAMRSSLSEDY